MMDSTTTTRSRVLPDLSQLTYGQMRNAILDLDVRVSSALLPDKTYGLYDESKRLILIDRRRFDINKSATEVCRRIVVGTPKTHELRTVMFPAVLGPLLPVRGKGDDDLLFADPTSPTGYIMQVDSPKTGSSWFTRACDAAGVPRMTVHDLRHTAASLMVRSGANVKAVQRQLGHASAAMTLDVYADLFDDDLDSVSESLDRLLKSSGD